MHNGREKTFFAAEMVVGCGQVNIRLLGNCPQRCRRIAHLHEEFLRGIQDAVPGRGSVFQGKRFHINQTIV